jgi:ATP/maltotriose-dependent transcriptional regulator MalT
MTDLPYPWADYARLQIELINTHKINNRAWGLEEGLNHILFSEDMTNLPSQDDIDRVVKNQERCERNRAGLRAQHLQGDEEEESYDPQVTVDAQQELKLLKGRVTDRDWELLCAVAAGYEYAEIAAQYKVCSGNLRTRVVRLRQKLVNIAA